MTLQQLINEANATYKLDLSKGQRQAILTKLRHAGVTSKHIPTVIDNILALAESCKKPRRATTAQAIYASLKDGPVEAQSLSCPRCGGDIREVKLVGERVANYCVACAIALPKKVQ